MRSLIPRKTGSNRDANLDRYSWFDRVLRDPFDTFYPLERTLGAGALGTFGAMDVSEDKECITVRIEAPGLSEKDLEVSYRSGMLTVRGEKKDEKEEKSKNRYYTECSYGSFCRQIPVGENIVWNKAKAGYKNGILTVTLPKNGKESKNITISIQ